MHKANGHLETIAKAHPDFPSTFPRIPSDINSKDEGVRPSDEVKSLDVEQCVCLTFGIGVQRLLASRPSQKSSHTEVQWVSL